MFYHQFGLSFLPTKVQQDLRGEALCRALQGRMALRLVALKETKPELKPSKCNQKNPIHLNETWICLLATGVSDTQLKTHWQSRAGGCGSQPPFPQVALEDTRPLPRALGGTGHT